MQMLKSKTPPLDARIEAFRAELDSFIDARVAEIKKECAGVPEGVLRNILVRGSGCQCAAVQNLFREGEQ